MKNIISETSQFLHHSVFYCQNYYQRTTEWLNFSGKFHPMLISHAKTLQGSRWKEKYFKTYCYSMGRNVESLQTDKRKDRLISEMRLKKLTCISSQASKRNSGFTCLFSSCSTRKSCLHWQGTFTILYPEFILWVSCFIRAFNGAFNRFLGHSDVLSIAIRRQLTILHLKLLEEIKANCYDFLLKASLG